MFLAMVWHGRRRQAALLEQLAAMGEVQRVSRENMRLLEQQQMFLVDASPSWARRSPWRSATQSSLSSRSLTRRSPRTPAWSSGSWRGCAGCRAACCCLPRQAALAFAGAGRVGPVVIEALDAGLTRRAGGGWGKWRRRLSLVTVTGWQWRLTRCWKTPSRMRTRTTASSSAPASRTGTSSWRWRTPAAAYRQPTWSGSSAGSPARLPAGAGRPAGRARAADRGGDRRTHDS